MLRHSARRAPSAGDGSGPAAPAASPVPQLILPRWCCRSSSSDLVPAMEEFGSNAGLSASVVTRLTTNRQEEQRRFADPDLSGAKRDGELVAEGTREWRRGQPDVLLLRHGLRFLDIARVKPPSSQVHACARVVARVLATLYGIGLAAVVRWHRSGDACTAGVQRCSCDTAAWPLPGRPARCRCAPATRDCVARAERTP